MQRLVMVLLVMVGAGAGWSAEPASAAWKPTFVHGLVTVGENDLATIALPEGMAYLKQADARHVLEVLWHNPPDPGVLGMIVPDPKEGQPEESWAIALSWDGSGYVNDSDAAKLDYAEILTNIQEACREANPEREKNGYARMDLVGWAEAPHYEASTHKIYWAKDLIFSDNKAHTLNYCVRILGARGVLELNAIDDLANLSSVAAASQKALAATSLTSGNRYEDHREGIDPVQVGGLAALIGGGLLVKKLGLLAVFGVFFLKFIKVIFFPLIFAASWLWKKFGPTAKPAPAPLPPPVPTVVTTDGGPNASGV